MAKVFNKKIEPACKYCIYGSPLVFSGDLICKYKGIKGRDDYCRRYKYDALKRVPSSVIVDDNYTKSDFEL